MELKLLRHGALGLEGQPQLLAPWSLRESGSMECGGSSQFSNLMALKEQFCKNQLKTAFVKHAFNCKKLNHKAHNYDHHHH